MAENTTFYPNDKVALTGDLYNTFKDTIGVTEWFVDHIKTPTKKNGVTLVICYPIKEGKKGVTLFQFTKGQLKKL